MIYLTGEEKQQHRDTISLLTNRIGSSYSQITENYPVANICPTCDGAKKYNLDDEVYECDCDYQKVLQLHYFNANIGREYHDISLAHFTGPDKDSVVPVVQDYIDRFNDKFHYGLGLTFAGPFGTGKTFAMMAVLKELIKQGRTCYFITFDGLINAWGSAWKDDAAKLLLEKKLKSVDVLGLDELRTDQRNDKGFLALGFDAVLRHRTSNLLPTIVTTNMTREDEADEFARAFSLLSARNTRVVTTGHDQRQREVRWRTAELEKNGWRRPII